MSQGLPYTDACIAVTGMSCRFPGADTIEQYWRNLMQGNTAMRKLSPDELGNSAHRDLWQSPSYVPMFCGLENPEAFAAAFFGVTPSDAQIIDPQQRLLLELAFEALEHSGDVSGDRSGDGPGRRTGVYASSGMTGYMLNNLFPAALRGDIDYFEMLVGNNVDFLSTRVAYKLDLTGPALSIQTACSSSLMALHLACQGLLLGECDRAVAGASTILVPDKLGYFYVPGAMLSPDGMCRPFDAGAEGTIFGSGAGCIVLKRLRDAEADGDPIWAVIRGSAATNDGAGKVSFTAPGVPGQVSAISEAMRVAGAGAADMSFVEAHGTGTPLGDPVEVAALRQAYRDLGGKEPDAPVLLGSVKGNIGHLDSAASMSGFIKSVLGVAHGVMPGTANFARLHPNLGPHIDPFYVSASPQPLPDEPSKRVGGINACGFGGTNIHLVIQGYESPSRPRTSGSSGMFDRRLILPLSAETPGTLHDTCERLAIAARDEAVDFGDAAKTLACGRKALPCRTVIKGRTGERLGVERLRKALENPIQGVRAVDTVFLFPGQGAHFPSMFRTLHGSDPRFAELFRDHAAMVADAGAEDPSELLQSCWNGDRKAVSRLGMTGSAQPLLFALELSLARLFMERGTRPDALLGHSLGEYVAACLAGVFSPQDAARLVVARAEAMRKAPTGRMLAALFPREDLGPLLGDLEKDLEVCVINGSANTVFTGPEKTLDEVRARLMASGGAGIYLATSHAFHSSSMNAVLDEFGAALSRTVMKSASIPVYSNASGGLAGEDIATPGYWLTHLRSTVRFADCLKAAFSGGAAGLELGPGNILSSLARQETDASCVAVFTRGLEEEPDAVADATAGLWLAGGRVDWEAYYRESGFSRIGLPGVVLERRSYWIDSSPYAGDAASGRSEQPGSARENAPGSENKVTMHARSLQTPFVEPRTDVERDLASLWEVTLSTAPVGATDAFIELGGNSLHVLRLIRMAAEKGYSFSIRDVFESRTVEGLAARAGALPGEKSLEAPKREARPAVKDVVGEDDMQALLAMLEG